MSAPEPAAVPDREARRARRDAEWARRDAEAEQRARLDARIDAAAAAAPSVLPGGVGAALAAVLEAMKPFRAADGYMAFRAVGRSSDEVVALAEAILAVPADAVRLVPDVADEVQWLRARQAAVLGLCDQAERRAHDMVGIFSGKRGAQVPHWVGKVRALLGTDTEEDA